LGSDRARLTIAPQQVRLLTPADGSVVIDPSVTLRFRPSGLAKSTTVRAFDAAGNSLASGAAPKNTTAACTGGACIVDTRSFGLDLRDGQTVYWSVASKNPFGQTVSVTRSFRVDLPGPVNILSPLDQQMLPIQPQFTWATRPTASSYILIVRNTATRAKSKLNVLSTGCTTMCAVTVGVPLANGPYWVQVTSRDAQGGKSKSPKHHFTLNVPPPSATPNGTLTPIPTIAPTSTFVMPPTFTLTPSRTPTINPFATLPLPTAPG
jgi:hypothetical protein